MKTKFNFTASGAEGEGAPPAACTLDALEASECARVVAVDTSRPAGTRLLDLGFLPGTPLRVLRRAPLGDPVVYELRGYQVCLRRVDASQVSVERVDDAELDGGAEA